MEGLVGNSQGRFSGVVSGLKVEKDRVTSADEKKRTFSSKSPKSNSSASSQSTNRRTSHGRDTSKSQSKATDSDECFDEEPSQYQIFLEQEVQRLTAYAEQAEETKDSLRRLEELRKRLAYLIFGIIGIWLIAVFCLVFLGSLDVYYFKGTCDLSERNLFFRATQIMPSTCEYITKGSVLNLSEKIVIALITTTTINILGLAYIVARWLYPDPNGKKNKASKKSKKSKNGVKADAKSEDEVSK